MAADDTFFLKIEHGELLVDRDTAMEVMRLLSGAQAIAHDWDLRKRGVYPWKYDKRAQSPHAVCSYVSTAELAQIELNTEQPEEDDPF